jgi:transcriptional regulator with XRE-family HTH domain
MAARTSGADRPSQIARQSPRFAAEAKALGERVRELRESRGWTLERAAEAMNLDLKHLQKVEAGKLNLTLVTLVRIAVGFDEQVASLFRRRGKS